MTELKPCPVCGNRVDIRRYCVENLKGGRDRVSYFFSHHPGPFGFCIIQATLDGKLFPKSKMDTLSRIWNVRDNECHTIGHLDEIDKVEFE